jgi:hypothetical protein
LHARSACHNRPRCRDPARSGSVQVDGLHNSTHPRRRSPRPHEFVGFEVRQLHTGRCNMTMHEAGTGGVKEAEPSPTLCRACHELIDAASSLMINVDYRLKLVTYSSISGGAQARVKLVGETPVDVAHREFKRAASSC